MKKIILGVLSGVLIGLVACSNSHNNAASPETGPGTNLTSDDLQAVLSMNNSSPLVLSTELQALASKKNISIQALSLALDQQLHLACANTCQITQ